MRISVNSCHASRFSSFFFLMLLIVSGCSSYQSAPRQSAPPIPGEPGKCYAKCLIPDQYIEETDRLPVYTGNSENPTIMIDHRTIILQPGSKSWEKKRAENCRSADPDDCLVWCLVDVPAKTVDLPVVMDTTQTTDFEWKAINRKILVNAGGFHEWREVVCQSDITNLLIRQLQMTLAEKDYFGGELTNQLSPELMSALSQFQKDHSLPVGQLDMASMQHLGIRT